MIAVIGDIEHVLASCSTAQRRPPMHAVCDRRGGSYRLASITGVDVVPCMRVCPQFCEVVHFFTVVTSKNRRTRVAVSGGINAVEVCWVRWGGAGGVRWVGQLAVPASHQVPDWLLTSRLAGCWISSNGGTVYCNAFPVSNRYDAVHIARSTAGLQHEDKTNDKTNGASMCQQSTLIPLSRQEHASRVQTVDENEFIEACNDMSAFRWDIEWN